ncbi:hypothetical protein I5Q34_08385 [Streptomyces sp. AV19]|uniref:hypothetical protein n=1 Tax=Streptomyces sp. AV19 TaxID=2793068 RepID=UPI0018FEC1F1|nr:hypothetical protein [Streptomyces sp. AV19]MBH1934310.1 hypothetical protein [Streptomyces sp. AV19]MDG4533382.1 hypothetical protein [Streptomyces sp. AV19]
MYGRDALLTGLVPRLVGLTPEHRRARLEYGDDLPVVLLTGARGTGKTAVLEQLRNTYRGHLPVALIDCESPEFAGPPHGSRAPWTPVTEALYALGEQLVPKVRGAGEVRFPRLAAGLLAAASSGWAPDEDERIRAEAVRLGLLLAPDSWWDNQGRTWLNKVVTKLSTLATTGIPAVDIVVEATVESLLEELFNRGQRKAADWYGSYPNAGGNTARGLVLLGRHFHRGDGHRAVAERHLAGALRADLAAAYAGVGRLRRIGRPLVLLDNAQAEPGRRILESVLHDRHEGGRDGTVVIAARRGAATAAPEHAVRLRFAELARPGRWGRGPEPGSGVLAAPIPALEAEDVRRIFDRVEAAPGGGPAGLYRAVHCLTGGRPLAVRLLAEAVDRLPDGREATPGALLDAPAQGTGRTTGAELLHRLVPADCLEGLVILAAARDPGSAEALAAVRLQSRGGVNGMHRAKDLLRREGWDEDPDLFVADLLLRSALLHRLYRQDPDSASWRAVHHTLRDYHASGEWRGRPHIPSLPLRLHHELALGRAESAVVHLRDAFRRPEVPARQWLDELLAITSAPYFAVPDHRGAVALGATDPRQPPPDHDDDPVLHFRIQRLLHAVWLVRDPLALHDARVVERMSHELARLSDLHRTGSDVLWQASREWALGAGQRCTF